MKKLILAILAVLALNLFPFASAEAKPVRQADGSWSWDLPKTAATAPASASLWKHNFEIGGSILGLKLPGKDGFGLGGLEVGYQPTYKLSGGQRLGLDLSGLFGGYDKGLTFGLDLGGVYYPIERLGLTAGYQFFLLKQGGKVDPGLGHYARLGVQVPVTEWFELSGFGLMGWGSYQTSHPQVTTTGDLTVTTTAYKRHSGFSGGGGGGIAFKF